MGATLISRRFASHETVGVLARAAESARRSPVAHAAYGASARPSGATLRIAQHWSGLRANRSLPHRASCSATVCSGVTLITLTLCTSCTASRVPMVSTKW